MSRAPIRAILFDLDGTLIDLDVPIEAIRKELCELFAQAGVETALRPILPGIERAAAAVSGRGGKGEALRQRALARLTEAELRAARAAPLRPGAEAAVRRAAALAPVALVTNNSRLAAEAVASRLPEVHLVVGREDCAAPKPAPDPLLEAVRRLAVQEGRVIMVGDSELDVRSARAAGAVLAEVEVVVVLGGRGGRDELIELGPDRVVGDLDELFAPGAA